MEVSGVSCETESPGLRRSKNIQINSSRLPPMMAANVVQHKMRSTALCAPPEIRTHIHVAFLFYSTCKYVQSGAKV